MFLARDEPHQHLHEVLFSLGPEAETKTGLIQMRIGHLGVELNRTTIDLQAYLTECSGQHRLRKTDEGSPVAQVAGVAENGRALDTELDR